MARATSGRDMQVPADMKSLKRFHWPRNCWSLKPPLSKKCLAQQKLVVSKQKQAFHCSLKAKSLLELKPSELMRMEHPRRF